jgi:PAS domain S-box-containing protein
MGVHPYVAAALAVVVAALVRATMLHVAPATPPFLPFNPAVLFAAWYGGFGPGCAATVLSVAACWYLMPPIGFSAPSVDGAVGLGLFAAFNVLVAVVVEAMHRQRRRAEQARDAARIGEERLAAALEVAAVGVWDVDLTRQGSFWADSSFDRAHPPAVRPGLDAWRERVHPDDAERSVREFLAAREERREYRCEHRVIWPSGETRWITARGKFSYDEVGRAVRLMGAFIDVTERRAAEDETRASAARFGSIMANMGEGLYTVDASGRLLFMNAAAERTLGWTQAELLGRGMHDVVHGRRADGRPLPAAECPAGRVLRSGEPLVDYDDFFVRRDGSLFPVVYSASRAEVDGQVLGLIVVFRDVTQVKQTLAERDELVSIAERARADAEAARDGAEAASRAKDSFLATISHELRTPLSPILAWAGMLRQGALDDTKRARAYEVIERSARTQAQLIEDLLDVSRIIAGRMRLEVRPVNLASVIERAIDIVRPAADAKGVRLQTVLDTETGNVLGDAERLQQVLWNLLANAVKFTPRGGRVHLALERVNSHIEIAVADTGQGIEPAFVPHVFDRFQQADGSSTRKYGGLGLGLAIVRHIVEAHGGSVHAESGGAGKGAVFTVKIPLMIPRAAGEIVRRHPTLASAEVIGFTRLDGVRVLVVDDEPDSNEAIGALLRSRGAEVRVAGSARDARDVLDAWRPDILVSDIGMPGEDGYGLIARLRQADGDMARMPAVALTAYASREDKIRVLTAGFHAHVPKPVDPTELVTVLANVARSRA